jgi:TldD protein
MTQYLDFAREHILAPSGLDENGLEQVLAHMMGPSVDYGDIYFQLSRMESWGLEDGIVKSGSFNIEQGAGVRAISGEKTGFAYSDEILLPALMDASGAARAIARHNQTGTIRAWSKSTAHELYLPVDPLGTLQEEEKIALLRQADELARSLDPRVKQVNVSLAGEHEVILVAASDGTLAADVRPLVRMNVSVIVEENGQQGAGLFRGWWSFWLRLFHAG